MLVEDLQRAAADVVHVIDGVTLVNDLLARCAEDGLHVQRDSLPRQKIEYIQLDFIIEREDLVIHLLVYNRDLPQRTKAGRVCLG